MQRSGPGSYGFNYGCGKPTTRIGDSEIVVDERQRHHTSDSIDDE